MADRMTNIRPGVAAPSRAGLVHDGASWIDAGQVPRFQAVLPALEHAVPVGVDGWQPGELELREFVSEHPDGVGGYLRVAPQSAWERTADDEVLLSGHELYRSVDGLFEVEPVEDQAEAERRRRLLERVVRWAPDPLATRDGFHRDRRYRR